MANPGPGSHDTHRGGFWAFWTTLPGILTGSAALLTAVVGLMTLLNRSAPEVSDSPIGAAPTASAEPDVSSSVDAASPETPSSAAVLIARRITMKSPDSADLEKGLVGQVTGEDLYLYCSGVECILNAMSSLMTLTEGASTKAACLKELEQRRAQALNLADLRKDQTLCVQTTDGHVGALRIDELPGVGSIQFVFSYTLWR